MKSKHFCRFFLLLQFEVQFDSYFGFGSRPEDNTGAFTAGFTWEGTAGFTAGRGAAGLAAGAANFINLGPPDFKFTGLVTSSVLLYSDDSSSVLSSVDGSGVVALLAKTSVQHISAKRRRNLVFIFLKNCFLGTETIMRKSCDLHVLLYT